MALAGKDLSQFVAAIDDVMSNSLEIEQGFKSAHLSVLATTQLISRSHFHGKFHTDPDLSRKQLCAVPVVLNFFLDLLSDGQFLRVLLFLCYSLSGLG
jgi:hypothetical protein